MVSEAELEETEAGLVAASVGWFVMNARDARWFDKPGQGHSVPLTGYDEYEAETFRGNLGLPIPAIELAGPSASAVILADRDSDDFSFEGLTDALALGEAGQPIDLRIFAKPKTLKNRRMGIALARSETVKKAVERAVAAAGKVAIRYRG